MARIVGLSNTAKNGGSWVNATTSTSKECLISDLSPNAAYEFRVYGERGSTAWSGVRSPVSNTVSVTLLPQQPYNLTVAEYTDTSVRLTWKTASVNGTDRWLIQYRKNGGAWVNAATSTSKECLISGLSPNATYEFRVYGERGSTAWSGVRSPVSNTVSVNLRAVKVHPIDISLGQGITYTGHQKNARDFSTAAGTPIYASMAGTIVAKVMDYPNSYNFYDSGPTGQMNEYGNYIDIKVADGTIIRYAHQQKTNISGIYVGATVYAGQQIGEVGNTGYSKGAHLHFETIGGGNVDDYYAW